MTGQPLLRVAGLGVALPDAAGRPVDVLDDVAFDLDRGETLGIVGESGSGKTMLALSIIGLLPPAAVTRGTVALDGRDLLALPEPEMCGVRGRRIAMIFQEPVTALNPAMSVGDQIAECIEVRGIDGMEAGRRAVELMDRVRIAGARERARAFPHELSGGQRQRVGIAMALASAPDLLIADEPTTAVDMSVQAEILDLIGSLVRESAMALILISHDLGAVARAAERLIVLYAGARLEAGPTDRVLAAGMSPYTRALLAARPRRRSHPGVRLDTIAGGVPEPGEVTSGCRFAGRCRFRTAVCDDVEPVWLERGDRGFRCHHPIVDEASP